ncbi:MAG: MMPL family transporter [Thermoleophilaceae bacterium]
MLRHLAELAHRRPRRILLATLLLVLAAGVLGGPVAGSLETGGGFTPQDAGSARAVERIEGATGQQAAPGVVLLVDVPEGATSAAGRARLAELARELASRPGIASVASLTSTRDERFVSADGRRSYVAATLRADAAEDLVAEAVQDRFSGASGVQIGGAVIAQTQLGETIGADLGRAELIAFPILVLLSLLFFRGRAAWLPLVVGVTTILGTFLAMSVVNQVYGLSIFALNLVIGLGLGLAIDYTLFLVSRFREELDRTGPGAEAVRTTLATAGRTVAFSSATVSVALITLTLFPLGFLASMGIAGALVALIAGVSSLVVTPAFFALWGSKLARRPRRGRDDSPGGWYRLSHAVMRRPGVVAAVTAAIMIALALPALRAEWTPVDASVIPTDQSARVVADALQQDFAGQDTTPLTVAIDAPASDRAGIADYAAGLASLGGVKGVTKPRALDERTWQVDVSVSGTPDGAGAQGLVEEVRDRSGAYPVFVGGAAAEFVDQQATIGSRLPVVVGLLLVLTFVLLWLMTGSVILPLKAIVMNALTVASALGVLTFIYQDGRLVDLLNYTPNGGIEPTDFLVTAVLVFALSTDYGVFLLGRIKEARDAGRTDREAVAVGLERTGAVVTAAAILLAVAVGAFSTSSVSFIQQIGIATATGVLLDAFVVRALLVPSLMALLGRWNWWSPAPLRRLHERIAPRERPGATDRGGHG